MMMKRVMPSLLMLSVCIYTCLGSLSNADEAADGLLEVGEYDSGYVRPEGYETLTIAGGGAYWIEARDSSYIEVQYTSTPLSNSSGISDIVLFDESKLLYLDGITEEIEVREDSTATIKGGTIDAITIYHLSSWSSQVIIYCQEGYVKTDSYISGVWDDGTSFYIEFIDVGGVFSSYPTADYVTVIPEPATLALLGIGGFLIRRKK